MSKIKVTAQQRANALEALNVMWPSVPEKNVEPGLKKWRSDELHSKPSCGTVACFGGWCAWWPSFRDQGVRASGDGWPVTDTREDLRVGVELFGDQLIFYWRGVHTADAGFQGTDHELVTNRLKWLIANSEVSA